MAEGLSIKVKVTPDTSGVQGELSGQAGKFNLPVKVSLQNVADVQTQIKNIGKNIDVKVNLTMAQNGVKNQLNSLKNQKVDMQLFDTTKLTQELNKVSSAIEKSVSKIQTALSTKIDSTMKATASNVENLSFKNSPLFNVRFEVVNIQPIFNVAFSHAIGSFGKIHGKQSFVVR